MKSIFLGLFIFSVELGTVAHADTAKNAREHAAESFSKCGPKGVCSTEIPSELTPYDVLPEKFTVSCTDGAQFQVEHHGSIAWIVEPDGKLRIIDQAYPDDKDPTNYILTLADPVLPLKRTEACHKAGKTNYDGVQCIAPSGNEFGRELFNSADKANEIRFNRAILRLGTQASQMFMGLSLLGSLTHALEERDMVSIGRYYREWEHLKADPNFMNFRDTVRRDPALKAELEGALSHLKRAGASQPILDLLFDTSKVTDKLLGTWDEQINRFERGCRFDREMRKGLQKGLTLLTGVLGPFGATIDKHVDINGILVGYSLEDSLLNKDAKTYACITEALDHPSLSAESFQRVLATKLARTNRLKGLCAGRKILDKDTENEIAQIRARNRKIASRADKHWYDPGIRGKIASAVEDLNAGDSIPGPTNAEKRLRNEKTIKYQWALAYLRDALDRLDANAKRIQDTQARLDTLEKKGVRSDELDLQKYTLIFAFREWLADYGYVNELIDRIRAIPEFHRFGDKIGITGTNGDINDLRGLAHTTDGTYAAKRDKDGAASRALNNWAVRLGDEEMAKRLNAAVTGDISPDVVMREVFKGISWTEPPTGEKFRTLHVVRTPDNLLAATD